MNKRIQELWKQSQTRQEVESFTEGVFHTRVTDNYEKFAELIVRECFAKLTPYMDDQFIGDVESELKEHFGVK